MSQITQVTWTAWEHDGSKWVTQPTVKYVYTNEDGRKSGQTFKPKTLADFRRLLEDASDEMRGSNNGEVESMVSYLRDLEKGKTNEQTWEEYSGKIKPTTTNTSTTNTQVNMNIDKTGTNLQVGSRVLQFFGLNLNSVSSSVRSALGKAAKEGKSTSSIQKIITDTGVKIPGTTNPPKNETTNTNTNTNTGTNTNTNTNTGSNNTSSPLAGPINQASQGAKDLIKKALIETDLTYLQNNSWWANSPYKNEAYNIIQQSVTSAQGLASMAYSLGITSVQNKSWWANSPYKNEAWNLILKEQNRSIPTSPTSPTTPTTPTTPTSPTTPTTPTANDPRVKSALDYINGSNLDESFKAILREVVTQWDFDGDNVLNLDKILTEFNRIKRETIDPEFASRANAFEQELIASRNFIMAQRESELEKERRTAGENIRQAREGLEKAGLTFTGKAIQDLGAQSAYAQDQPQQQQAANPDGSVTITRPDGSVVTIPASELGITRQLQPITEGQPTGQTGVVPTQPTFGGMFYEGKVNQLNRLMSQGSEVGHRSNIDTLGRQAEQMLGSGRTTMLGIPGFNVAGNVTGTIETQKQQYLGDVLKSLAAKENKNYSNRDPVFTTDILNQF